MFVIAAIIVLGFTYLSFYLYSLVASQLWAWFVVPLLSLPPLPAAYAFGLMLVISSLRGPKIAPKKLEEQSLEDNISQILGFLLGPLILYLLGWITHNYFM